jgi:hypothetical protein
VRERSRTKTIADMPAKLRTFRYRDWCAVDGPESDADGSAENAGYLTTVVARGYARWQLERKAWCNEHCPDDSLEELLQRRRDRPRAWFDAMNDARAVLAVRSLPSPRSS